MFLQSDWRLKNSLQKLIHVNEAQGIGQRPQTLSSVSRVGSRHETTQAQEPNTKVIMVSAHVDLRNSPYENRKQISPMIKLLSITLCWHGTWYLIINEYQLAPTLCGGKHNTPFPSLPLTLVGLSQLRGIVPQRLILSHPHHSRN